MRTVVEMAKLVAARSRDTSTKVGAVIVTPELDIVAIGCNDIPRAVEDTQERRERPKKYLFTEHAERAAIYSAGRHGVSCDGCLMIVTHFPCADCARAIIQAGIAAVVHLPTGEEYAARWAEHIEAAQQMLGEAGVGVWVYS